MVKYFFFVGFYFFVHYLKLNEVLISFLIIPSLSLLLLVPKGGIAIALILALSIVGLFVNKRKLALSFDEKFFVYSFLFYSGLILFNVFVFDGQLRDFDVASRFLLVLPIYFYLRKSNINPSVLILGIVVSCSIFGINTFLTKVANFSFIEFTKGTGIVSLYGSILGVSCLFFIGKNNKYFFNLFYILSGFLGIVTSVMHGGRGVWVASIITFLFLYILNPSKWNKFEKIMVLCLTVSMCSTAYFLPNSPVKRKLDNAIQTTANYFNKNVPTSSVGARLEMWKGSLMIIKDNFVLGIGEDNFKEEKQKLIDSGVISPSVSIFNHPHGEFISSVVEQGIFGLISLILVFLSPLKLVLKGLKNDLDQNQSRLHIFVISLSLHYLFYSFTNGVFDHQNTTLLYSAFIAMALSLSMKTTSQK